MKKFSSTVEFKLSTFTPSKSIKNNIMKEAVRRYPQYEFKWVEKALGLSYVPFKDASATVVRERKNLNTAEKATVVASAKTEDGKLLISRGAVEGTEFRPCILDDSIVYHDVEDFATKFFISCDGKIICTNDTDNVYTSDYLRYGTTHCADFVVNGEHINQTIRGLIRRSWGEESAQEYIFNYEQNVA